MSPREPTPKRLQITPSGIVAALSVAAVLWNASTMSGRVDDALRRIGQLETSDRQKIDALGRIDARTARIEATLDIITRGGIDRPLSPLPRQPEQTMTP